MVRDPLKSSFGKGPIKTQKNYLQLPRPKTIIKSKTIRELCHGLNRRTIIKIFTSILGIRGATEKKKLAHFNHFWTELIHVQQKKSKFLGCHPHDSHFFSCLRKNVEWWAVARFRINSRHDNENVTTFFIEGKMLRAVRNFRNRCHGITTLSVD